MNRLSIAFFSVLALFTGIALGFLWVFLPTVMVSEPVLSPFDHIDESQIQVFDDKVIVHLQGSQTGWARFAPTNSMLPVLRDGHNSIEITPQSEEDIHIGDIISFQYVDPLTKQEDLVVHRVIDVGRDAEGWYALTKGDHNRSADPGVRRFDDVVGILVMLIY